MHDEEIISLECPYCQASITQPMNWFKRTYSACPSCNGGLAAEQFAPLIESLEQAFDASVEDMILGEDAKSCAKVGGCGNGSCKP